MSGKDPRNSGKKSSKKSSKKKQQAVDEDEMQDQKIWVFPQEIINDKYDVQPLYHEIQKEFALSTLRNQI